MQLNDLQPLIREKPALLVHLYGFDGQLNQVEVFSPQHPCPRYDAFCEKLSITEKPHLIVVEDMLLNKKGGKEYSYGYYDDAQNVIIMRRSAFERFINDKSAGNYVTSHLLAQKTLSRRKFIVGAAAISGAAAAGVATGWATKQHLQQRSGAEETSPYELIPAGIAGAAAAYFTHNKILDLALRHESFAADGLAAQATSIRDTIVAMGQLYIESVMGGGDRAAIHALQSDIQQFDNHIAPDLRPEDVAFYRAIAISTRAPQRDLVDILKDPNPTMPERIDKLAPESVRKLVEIMGSSEAPRGR